MQTDTGLIDYTHLNVHSCYTMLGGTSTIADLVAQAVADGLSHLALTDTNALYGVVTFCAACKAAGITPIVGMTISIDGSDDTRVKDPLGRVNLCCWLPVPKGIVHYAGYRQACRAGRIGM